MADQGGTVQIPGGSTNPMLAQMLHAMNWAKNIVRLAVNYYLPIIDTTYGNTGWYLFANPESGRPAIEMGFLRGHKTPELFMKLPNAVAIGEGQCQSHGRGFRHRFDPLQDPHGERWNVTRPAYGRHEPGQRCRHVLGAGFE